MRDNEERLQQQFATDSTAAVVGSDSLNFSVPTEFVELPSKGKFYPAGHPLKDKESIEIKFMTAKEEDILTSKALIRKGVAVDRMIQSLLIDKSVQVADLLVGDKNAVTLAARISGYGEDYTISFTCPSCDTKQKHSFDLSQIKIKDMQDLSDLGLQSTGNGTFVVSLIKTKAEVEFRLLNGKDEAEMISDMNRTKGNVAEEKNSTSQLKRIIVSINGEKNKQFINNFVESMPVIDAKFLRNLVKDVTPDVDMSQEFNCSNCGHNDVVEVPFTVEFFWPK